MSMRVCMCGGETFLATESKDIKMRIKKRIWTIAVAGNVETDV